MKLIKLLLFFLPFSSYSQTILVDSEIFWHDNLINDMLDSKKKVFFAFSSAEYDENKDFLPFYSHQIKLGNQEIFNVEFSNVEYEVIDKSKIEGVSGDRFITNNHQLKFDNSVSKKENYGIITFIPIIYKEKSNEYLRIKKFQLSVSVRGLSSINKINKKSTVTNSVLATGDWYKFGVLKNGVFKLDYEFLKNLGVDVDQINPQQIKIYGNGGKMLPEINSKYRHDDLKQNAIVVEGENDGVFDRGDYILFYGQSPDSLSLSSNEQYFYNKINLYSDTTFYFITVSSTGELPKRIQTVVSASSPNKTVTSFNDFQYYEKEVTNLIKSGQDWYGELFDVKTSYDFVFNIPNIDVSSLVRIAVSGAARSDVASAFSISSGGATKSFQFSPVTISCYSCSYASSSEDTLSFMPSSDIVNVKINYSKPNSGSIAWLDKIQINSRRNLVMNGNQMIFRDLNSVGLGNISQFYISAAENIQKVWDITDPLNITSEQLTTGMVASFVVTTDSLREFIALTSSYDTQVIPVGKIDNQNLHGLSQNEYIIVSHPNFLNQAEQVADFHRQSGMSVVVVTPQQIYNEFSSGSQDPIAIRSFVKMFYDRANNPNELPKYLLLFGDGSYDNKNRIFGNTNFIPTYQSVNSLGVIGSLVTDDYYGLLDPAEGNWSSGIELIDIGIGRMTVKNQQEADNVVNKIVNYSTSATMKDWRNQLTFIGDDEDSNEHMRQSDFLAKMVETSNPEYNPEKIFFDTYKQETTPGGNRYPEVNKEIINSFEEGALIINYTGHGGETGWAHERVLTVDDINNFENTVKLPLIVTATCEFSRFDDPKRTSAGELLLINKSGGIGLLTTVRLVFSSPNFALNQSLYDKVFLEANGENKTIGEIFQEVKNLNAASSNNRNFTLLGDPALKLAYPKHDVKTTHLNGVAINPVLDTIKALQKVTINGYIQDKNGNKLTNYNGTIYPTVFDKSKTITSLKNDGGALPFVFNSQNSKIFKGKASVTNGDFSFSFVVPKDIAYNIDKGKLSYYAENQQIDANGYFTEFYIGGTASNYTQDNEGPQLELYMNDKTFVYGGITDENPKLLAYVSDLHGINMVGNGIGHDIVAVLDDETDKAFILNNYYEADLNSYQKGLIKFPFSNLEEGRHKLTLKVWDVYNNSSEITTEFNVVKAKNIVINRVYNYPNPFTTHTEFWFEHNQSNKQMFAQIQIFTVSGKLVKTISKNITNEGFRSTSITWDGLDDFGDRLARGVYIYHLKVRAENMSIADKYEKLVIL
ncbi:MAG: type IX secretion system sortase PorU [Flavobacteriales bacterium]|nr:type IX secretion system sortase PorU [Flavobacteriales bacterium]